MKKNLYQSPIDSKDGDELKEQISSLISRHNLLCAIERVFDNNPIASDAFEEAAKEVHDNNNQSFANIFVRAIEIMAEKIEDTDNASCTDQEALIRQIQSLKAENNMLKSKLGLIGQLVNKEIQNNGKD